MRYFYTLIDQDILNISLEAASKVSINRTKTSPYDIQTGVIGEVVFAKWFLGDIHKHNFYSTKGKSDFFDEIEIKTSAYPLSNNLNLLVREDYAIKRKPKYYIQMILDIKDKNVKKIDINTKIYIIGYATSDDVDKAALKDFGSKFKGDANYKCKYIPFNKLRPIINFKNVYKGNRHE